MERLRKTLSFRRKKKTPESSKPHQWQEDEKKVREGTCSFQVKYLGSVEVFESRGMQVCEDAVKVLYQRGKRKYQQAVLYVSGDALRVVEEISKNMKKATRFSFRKKPRGTRPVYATLYISGDSLRVVEDRAHMDAMSRITSASDELNKGLIVDQTIEKVSFCAPDRNHEKAFAYICRDGTTRRWLCHAFLALKESGERLSHAVGCAFAVCLEKKQKREREAVQVTYSDDKTTFTRMGSFRQTTLTERMLDPQSAIVTEPVPTKSGAAAAGVSGSSASASKPAVEVTAVRERPQATPDAFMRLGSFREFPKLSTVTSPFKRQLSLRLNELPSNVDRQQHDFRGGAAAIATSGGGHDNEVMCATTSSDGGGGAIGPAGGGGASLAGALTDPTTSKASNAEPFDPIAAMCQQLSQGLSSMTAAGGSSSVPKLQPPSSQWPAGAAAAATVQQQPQAGAVQWSSTASAATANGWQLHAVTTANPPALASSTARPAVSGAAAAQLPAKSGLPPSAANQSSHVTAAHGATGAYWSSAPQAAAQHRPAAAAVAAAPGHSRGAAAAVTMTASEADPFDAAWAMRTTTSSATNPFLPGPPPQQPRHKPRTEMASGASASKSFEMKM